MNFRTVLILSVVMLSLIGCSKKYSYQKNCTVSDVKLTMGCTNGKALSFSCKGDVKVAPCFIFSDTKDEIGMYDQEKFKNMLINKDVSITYITTSGINGDGPHNPAECQQKMHTCGALIIK
jgi:hypothetical protein